MAQALTEEALQKAFDEAVENLPKNVIKKHAKIVDAALEKGLKFDRISEVLAKNFNIDLKPSAIKKAYYEAFPDKKKTRVKKNDSNIDAQMHLNTGNSGSNNGISQRPGNIPPSGGHTQSRPNSQTQK